MGENPVANKFICNGLRGTVAVKVLADEGADHQIYTVVDITCTNDSFPQQNIHY